MHMHTSVKTQAQMEAGPSNGTVFHSELPYVLAGRQFEISSYSNWGGQYRGGAGRRFTIPAAMKSYKSANPDLAFLLILTDSSGRTWLHDPVVRIAGATSHSVRTELAAFNGADYQVAYTSNTAQISALTQNYFNGSTFSINLRTWDTGDNYITVIRTPYRTCQTHDYVWGGLVGSGPEYIQRLTDLTNPAPAGSANVGSVGLDVVRVKAVFLNVVNTASQFTLQKGYNPTSNITLKDDVFSVGGLDLGRFTPLVSHGSVGVGGLVTKVNNSSILVAGKSTSLAILSPKMNTSNRVEVGPSPVLEIPLEPPASSSWVMDLKAKSITNGGRVVFNTNTAGRALMAIGSRQITFSTSVTVFPGVSTTSIGSSQSGNLGSVNSNTLFLASIYGEGGVLQSTSLMGVGNNLIFDGTLRHRSTNEGASGAARILWFGFDYRYYLNISSSGVCTVYRRTQEGYETVNFFNRVNSVFINHGTLGVRLIALGNSI